MSYIDEIIGCGHKDRMRGGLMVITRNLDRRRSQEEGGAV